MSSTFQAVVAGLVLAASFGGPVSAGLLEDAAAAYRKGDYGTALLLVSPLAERGNVHAQARLALLYDLGQGVPQDDAAAMSWYRKAAEQGYADAERSLGNMYRIGRGAPELLGKAGNRRTSVGAVDYLGFHSRANFCASPICAGVMRLAMISRFLSASSKPLVAAKLSHM
jgi:Sel1 repeat-containing protein